MEFRLFRPALRAPRPGPLPGRPTPRRPGRAAQSGRDRAEVRILARSQERDGRPRLRRGRRRGPLRRDPPLRRPGRVRSRRRRTCRAEGNVVVQSGREVIRGERVLYNLETGRGTIEAASGLIAPDAPFRGGPASSARQADRLQP
ncbi:MAG: hypothetical protein M0C28_05365 [Candidatus Moduliflexus flocculans]|nr:hypothetical protein [Candidatus Moduliflexus flocculans]